MHDGAVPVRVCIAGFLNRPSNSLSEDFTGRSLRAGGRLLVEFCIWCLWG